MLASKTTRRLAAISRYQQTCTNKTDVDQLAHISYGSSSWPLPAFVRLRGQRPSSKIKVDYLCIHPIEVSSSSRTGAREGIHWVKSCSNCVRRDNRLSASFLLFLAASTATLSTAFLLRVWTSSPFDLGGGAGVPVPGVLHFLFPPTNSFFDSGSDRISHL